MVRRGDGSRVNYAMERGDGDDDNEDYSDEDQAPAKKRSKSAPVFAKKSKPTSKSPRGKISPAKTPASKKKLQQKKQDTSSPTKRTSGGRAKNNISYADDASEEEEEEDDEVSDDDDYRRPAKGKNSPAAKKSSPAKKSPAAKKGASASREQFPPVSEMVLDSIKALHDHPKKGSTLGSIKETIALNWPVNMKVYDAKIKKFIVRAVETGELVQTKGKGFNGRFTVPGLKLRKKKKKAQKLSKKLDEDVEEEYKPTKTARDEEREKDHEELERRRQERKLWMEEEAAKKASKPKKHVARKEDFEVEDIKGKRTDKQGKVLYLVKFKGWLKAQWEPEENVQGCDEIINDFLKREKQRLKELDDRKRREEEDGAYEVKRILEVKFPKNKPREFLIRWVGHSPDDDTWEPEENLTCPDLIQKFMLNWEKVSQVEEKRLREDRKPVVRLAFANRGSRTGKRNNGFRVTYEGMED